MKQIFWILMIAVVIIAGSAWLIYRVTTGAFNNSKIAVHNQTGSNANGSTAATTSMNPSSQTEGPPTANPIVSSQSVGLKPPVADSISRNPPNGMVFAGTGKYQLYRQGDITWRLNTDSGDACILLATDAQWRQQRVYQRGCGAS
jgi:hypothetical protein